MLIEIDGESHEHSFQAYSASSGMDPMGCLRQTQVCMHQQHYLDPKYHGAGSSLAKAVHVGTGEDENKTKMIINVSFGLLFVGIILFAVKIFFGLNGHAITPVSNLMPAHPVNRPEVAPSPHHPCPTQKNAPVNLMRFA
jgi:hypothetical protein